MTNEAQVYFALKGESFDPDQFTRWTGLSPTDVLRKGAPRRYGHGIYPFGMWMMSTGWHKNDVLIIREIVDGLVEQLEFRADRIASVVGGQCLYAVLEVVLHVSSKEEVSTPALSFSTKTIAFLNRVGAEIKVDIYRCERSAIHESGNVP